MITNDIPEKYRGRTRNITDLEEAVLRCVHHEFAGMDQTEAAAALGISESMVSRALGTIREKAETCRPIRIMLPILTKLQFKIYKLYVKRGMPPKAIAAALNITLSAVNQAIGSMRSKGQHIPKQAKFRCTRYDASMDNKITNKL